MNKPKAIMIGVCHMGFLTKTEKHQIAEIISHCQARNKATGQVMDIVVVDSVPNIERRIEPQAEPIIIPELNWECETKTKTKGYQRPYKYHK